MPTGSSSLPSSPGFPKAVALVALIAGTTDILAAHLHIWAASGRFPTTVFKAIAGGVLGPARAMQGGAEIMVLGVFLHFFISLAFTLFFFVVYPRLAWLRKSVWRAGIALSFFVWVVMTYVVLPLSLLSGRAPDFTNKHTYIGMVVMIVVFGLPVAFGAARFYRTQPRSQ
jgi:hypothetical protein